ncbi:MAG: chromosome condensation protein, partial [Pirellula sp.]
MSVDTNLPTPQPTLRAKRLFPLYFSPIESLFIADDRPDYPMAFIVQMTFTGMVNRAAFESALPAALARHPLLKSHRQLAKRGLPCWVPAPDTMPFVNWGKEGDPVDLPHGESINLEFEVGLRIWLREGSGTTMMTMQFHHS